MIVYKKKSRPDPIFIILLFLVFLVIPTKLVNYKNLGWDLYEKISTYDLGSSSIHNIAGGTLTTSNSVFELIKKSPKVFSNLIFGVDRNDNIEKIYIDIKFKNYKKLLKDRETALLEGIGHDYQTVKGEVTSNGKKIKSKIRLKGHLSDHWRSKYRMSFRIKLLGKNSLFGFKEFSLHKPSARQHPYDQTFQEIQRNLGNISSEHKYVNLFVNGEDWGIMNIEEHLTKEFLEKQEIKESLIVEFGNEKHDIYKRTVKSLYDNYRISDPYLNVNILKGDKYLKKELYRKWFTYISLEHLKHDNNLYDIDSFSKALLLSLIWNNTHSLFNQNSRYYFNPYNLKLHPITSDQSFFSPIREKLLIPKPYEKIIGNSLFNLNFEKNFKAVKSEISKSQEVINKWQDFFPLDSYISSEILKDNQNMISKNFRNYIINPDETDKHKYAFNSISKEQSKFLYDHIFAVHHDNGQIDIYNLTREKIILSNIYINGKELDSFETTYIEGQDPLKYEPLILKTNLKGFYDNKIEIKTELNNEKRVFKLGYSMISNGIFNPLNKLINLAEHEFLIESNFDEYRIKKGTWNIHEPLVIDKDLIIEKGVNLIFRENAYLIIKGSLKILGETDNKVVLSSKGGFWKGLYVIDADKKSYINNAVFSNVTYLKDGILELSGGISFYNSNVEIKNTSFNNSNAEDFLNIVHSNFEIDNVTFSNSLSDAFDSDFSKGTIKNSSFYNIKGDGIDFSGSVVNIINSNFKNIKDKAVSVGEKSSLKISEIYVDSVGVGVASKDGSFVQINNSRFSNYTLNALMSYQKKSHYKKSSLIGMNIGFDNKENSYSRQKNSIMTLNGNLVQENEINVDLLYENEIMKKND
jgi:hypothetical protein